MKWFDDEQGIGLIDQEGGGPDVVAYRAAIQGPDRKLMPGENVHFGITRDAEGLRADNISRVPSG
ncbi:cold shock domain-containing protein [Streptomyces xanthophaeus]|uniref:cold shock domain-containing protein n=1 Tax=Streptomyces xanthophaeus TaxID=67385 RepID=UPI00398F9461